MKSLDEWNTLPHWSLLGIGYFSWSKIKSLQKTSEPFMRSGEHRFSLLLFLNYSCFEFCPVCIASPPWERRSLNFNINSASISGNLTFAFAIFEPPVLKSLRFFASAAAWKIISASLIHSENRPWEILYTGQQKLLTLLLRWQPFFLIIHQCLLLWTLANMAFPSFHLCCFFDHQLFSLNRLCYRIHLRRTAKRKHILNFP